MLPNCVGNEKVEFGKMFIYLALFFIRFICIFFCIFYCLSFLFFQRLNSLFIRTRVGLSEKRLSMAAINTIGLAPILSPWTAIRLLVMSKSGRKRFFIASTKDAVKKLKRDVVYTVKTHEIIKDKMLKSREIVVITPPVSAKEPSTNCLRPIFGELKGKQFYIIKFKLA